MYIAQAFKGLHDWWRYIIGIIIALVGLVIFSIPHALGVFLKTMRGGSIDQSKMGDTAYLMGLFEPNLNLVFILLPFVGGLLFLLGAVKWLHKQSFTSLTTARPKIDWKRFWVIFFFWGILSSSLVLIDYYMSPEDYVFNFNLQPFLILCVIAIILVPLQTSFEEYLFRGYIMQGLGVVTRYKVVPLIFTSIVFGLLHMANPEVDKLGPIIMVYYIGTGLFLGIMTLMDDGLELALGFHAANNLFTALLVTADWTAFQTHSVLKDISDPQTAGVTVIIVPVFIMFPIILFILSKMYNWTDWKGKLFGKVVEPNHKFKVQEEIDTIGIE
ncbi:CPBP family intramembrane glutamic endopeptidase [Gelidibacter salicanalis]|uniref:CPBP family intramembrane metalloprotease n=1 Tax=Gelidibacter salicanalis TaxID=291193 RepID=A0A934KSG5_9FLAO|nr:CPBP family intramembrane glutamic endopeptidase [Gelidibacter salicanalis]MBJ7879927.1 CPBP family intramembrane metalloprotease [Gelidibacter salicanalis]